MKAFRFNFFYEGGASIKFGGGCLSGEGIWPKCQPPVRGGGPKLAKKRQSVFELSLMWQEQNRRLIPKDTDNQFIGMAAAGAMQRAIAARYGVHRRRCEAIVAAAGSHNRY